MLNRLSPVMKASLVLSGAIVTAGAVTAIGKPAPHPAPPSATIIATVRIDKAIDGLAEKNEKQKLLDARAKEMDDKLKAMLAEFKAEEEAFKAMPPGPARSAAGLALAEKAARLRNEDKITGDIKEAVASDMIRELYLKIDEAAEALAKQRGYHLVLSSDEAVPVGKGSMEELSRTIALKRMLYVDPSLDITDELVLFMNNQFAAGPKK